MNFKAIDFRSLGISETSLSELMGGRTKIETDDVIRDYPDGITVLEFDIIDCGKGVYPLFIFKEDDTKFLNGGMILSKVVNRWVKEFDGDIAACSESLKSCGGVKIKLSRAKTSSGNVITLVEFV